ncbi:MAG TPA: hypothetical protein PK126_05785 [Candidatus Syntrophosphaera thermopropionivorans]|jgi:hypothetical protein|nr:hypothetical protein [Candidatus Syntrophosphaera thermopropionivorans]HOQ83925.1 hypothetical protein [Candidatus Syntrophosphaera thermopropionivorans]HPQ31181.1 hypothetical protein [Candidatus Syntrophosphaera thermopropionivorans]HQH48197.1 hypothetical protein [Candidatus Syntrophosphaera thermopropionivorans]HQK58026.1 hypothetical protein [Candidatus Syntrophosphaera thermopropionivorans]
MKTKSVLIIMAVAVLIIMTACSGVPKEKKLTVSNVNVIGDAKDLIKVADGTYTLQNANNELSLTINLQLLQNRDLEMEGLKLGQWTLNLLDKDGNSIPGAMLQFKPESGAELQIIEFLKNGMIDDTLSVTFSQMVTSQDELKKIMKQTTSFELTTVIESIMPGPLAEVTPEETKPTKPSTTQPAQKPQAGQTTPQTTPETSPTATPVKPSEDWDKELDAYSAAIDRYISMKNNLKPGDANAIRRLNEQKAKIDEMTKRFQTASGMTAAQSTRFKNLKAKFDNAG